MNYIPAKGRKSPIASNDLPYEMCALEAIKDFTQFLIEKHALGEIVIESRFNQDSIFVKYFDHARKVHLPKGKINPLAQEASKRINSILIANKRIVNGGLEIAVIGSFVTYRKLTGDPQKQLKVDKKYLRQLSWVLENHVYLKDNKGRRIRKKELK